MAQSRILEVGHAFVSAIDDAGTSVLSDAELVDAMRHYGSIHDLAEAAAVLLIGRMIRRGVFTAHGYTRPEYAIAQLLGWDQRPARRRVKLAEQVCPRLSLDGQPLPALLPVTATVFAEGRITVGVAEAIVAVLNGPAAQRLQPDVWAGVEEQVATYAATHRATPNEITNWARQLIEAYDQDGAEPDDEPDRINELTMSRKPGGTGGWIRGELDGPTYEALHTAMGALCRPRTGARRNGHPAGDTAAGDTAAGAGMNSADDTQADAQAGGPHPLGFRANTRTPGPAGYVDERTLPQRQADALGELCEFALHHDDTLPDTGGERPQIRVTLDLERLRAAVAGAHLDTGAWYSPSQLRMLACDAFVIPAVLRGNSEPLDIGRASRTVSIGIRRAVAVRDGGCSFPGCNRPPTWCDVHHCLEWAEGGDTAVENCTMLCRRHHTIVHQTGWKVRIQQGQPEFTPPEFIDRHQRIRRRPRVSVG